MSIFIVRVKDLDSKNPPIMSVLVVSEFPEVFLDDYLRIPPEWDIGFCIVLLSDTNPVSINPYRMALPELELKAKVKDLLDKGLLELVFIHEVHRYCL